MFIRTIAHRAVKFNSVVLAAMLITFLLFYFMQYLVATSNPPGPQFRITKLIDATVPVFENTIIESIEPPAPLQELPPPEMTNVSRADTDGINVSTAINWTQPTAPRIGVTDIPLSSNIMIPLIRTAANYPSRALTRGIEGFVELSFTVNELGNVQDPVVLYAEPEGYFERAALQSIQRWKYSAAMEKGTPVPTYGVRQRIVFQIDPATR